MGKVKYPPYEVVRERWWIWELKYGIKLKLKNTVVSFQTKKMKGNDMSELGFKIKSIVGLAEMGNSDLHKLPVTKSKLWKGKSDKN